MAWSVLSKPYGLPYILPEAIKVMIIFGRMRYSAHWDKTVFGPARLISGGG
jgi:hypothetical protein